MKSKHPIRIALEVLVVLVLAGGVARMYLFKDKEDPAASSEDARDVARLMKTRSSDEGGQDNRVFGKEPPPEAAPDATEAAVEAEPPRDAILILEVLDASSMALYDQSVELVSADCGWSQSFPNGSIKLLVPVGACTFHVATAIGKTDEQTVDFQPGKTVQQQLVVGSASAPVALGTVDIEWKRESEWIELTRTSPNSVIQPGDIVLEINGVPVRSANDQALAELLLGPPDQIVRFTLAVPEGEGWEEVPVNVPRQAISY